MLPSDPVILLSVANTRLRDGSGGLEELCAGEDVSSAELKARLAAIGYRYEEEKNQFVPEL